VEERWLGARGLLVVCFGFWRWEEEWWSGGAQDCGFFLREVGGQAAEDVTEAVDVEAAGERVGVGCRGVWVVQGCGEEGEALAGADGVEGVYRGGFVSTKG
jgi:hypothetical protein